MDDTTGALVEIAPSKPTLLSVIQNAISNYKPREMHDDEYFWFRIWRATFTAVVIVILGMLAYNAHFNAVAREIEKAHVYGGYCQVSVNGIGSAVWQKCK